MKSGSRRRYIHVSTGGATYNVGRNQWKRLKRLQRRAFSADRAEQIAAIERRWIQ